MVLLPGETMPKIVFFDLMGFDKIIHFFSFTLLAFMMIIGLSKQYSEGCYHFNIYYLTVLSLIGYGIILEYVQGYVPGRTFEWADAIANGIGVLSGRALFFLIYKTRLV
jgi:VanZ family protein